MGAVWEIRVPAGGGGVLRDSSGNFIFGFSKFFGSCSNNEAELRAVVEGIFICKHLGHDGIDIECDYDIVVSWIRSRICNLWYLWDFWDQLIDLLKGFDFSIHHFYRECNKVADALTRYGASGRNNVFSSSSQLPGVIKGFLHLDKLDLLVVEAQVSVSCHNNEGCKEYKCKQGRTPHCIERQCSCNVQTILDIDALEECYSELDCKCPLPTCNKCIDHVCLCICGGPGAD
ncbi:hypothetical protein Q3G72_023379 [Acer saccharum]|nr:hypothetical protein Q3G72_023379 [Acer saccharum]